MEVLAKKAAASSSPGHGSEMAVLTPPSHAVHAAAADGAARGVKEDEDGRNDHATMATVDDPNHRRAHLEPHTIEDYYREKLHKWLKVVSVKSKCD